MTTIEAKLADAAVAQKSTGAPNRTVFDLLKQQQSEIERALPRHMDADRFARIAMTQLRRTPALLTCDAASIISSVMRTSDYCLLSSKPSKIIATKRFKKIWLTIKM